MKRLFIAVRIEAGTELITAAAAFKTGLGGENIKWTDITTSHITIAFLGDTDEKLVKPLGLMLSEKSAGFGRFTFLLKGAGVFRNLKDPRVIWLGIEMQEELVKLYNLIAGGLREMDLPVEERPFRPHLTLGRIKYLKNTDALSNLLVKYRDKEIQRVEVDEIILYESILMSSGPVYKPLGYFKLKR